MSFFLFVPAAESQKWLSEEIKKLPACLYVVIHRQAGSLCVNVSVRIPEMSFQCGARTCVHQCLCSGIGCFSRTIIEFRGFFATE